MSVRPNVSRKERAAETEAALKAAAKRVFARQGYLNTKITDITAEAGRAAGSFYNHFSGKEELLSALLNDLFAAGDSEIVEADTAHSPDYSDRAAVRWHIAAYWNLTRDQEVTLTAIRQAALVNEEFAAKIQQLSEADGQHVRGHLAYVERAGRQLPGDPTIVTAAMSAMLENFAYSWQRNAARGDFSDDEVIDTLTEMLYRGLNGTS